MCLPRKSNSGLLTDLVKSLCIRRRDFFLKYSGLSDNLVEFQEVWKDAHGEEGADCRQSRGDIL